MQTCLKSALNKLIRVQLTDNSSFAGTLLQIDGNMNIVIKNAVYQQKEHRRPLKLVFIRGESVYFMIMSTTTSEKPKEEKKVDLTAEPVGRLVPGLAALAGLRRGHK